MKQFRTGLSLVLILTFIGGCDTFYNDPQAEITVVNANGDVVEEAVVRVYATADGYDYNKILSNEIWESEFSLHVEGVTNKEGKILFTTLVAPHFHFIRVSKGVLNNNLGIQSLGQLNMDQIVKVTIEIN